MEGIGGTMAVDNYHADAANNRGGLSEQDFDRFSQLIHGHCGIKMPPVKKNMLEARLRKRLRQLTMQSFEEYSEYVFSRKGMAQELVNLIDVVTTNKTDFFREPAHFDYLTRIALPKLINTYGAGIKRPLKVWSAGCSTGEEPYTLAMVLSEFAEQVEGFEYSILATDISTQVLEKAKLGVFRQNRVETIDPQLQKRYLLRGKDTQEGLVRVAPELRSRVTFRRVNFMDDDLGVRWPIDILFCRNVIIYFDRPTQEQLLGRLSGHLFPGRYLFMGHSETLSGMNLPFYQMAPSVYLKK